MGDCVPLSRLSFELSASSNRRNQEISEFLPIYPVARESESLFKSSSTTSIASSDPMDDNDEVDDNGCESALVSTCKGFDDSCVAYVINWFISMIKKKVCKRLILLEFFSWSSCSRCVRVLGEISRSVPPSNRLLRVVYVLVPVCYPSKGIQFLVPDIDCK